jgi:flagellar basal body-associated protein FliL
MGSLAERRPTVDRGRPAADFTPVCRWGQQERADMSKKKLGIAALVAVVALSLSGCIKVVSNIVLHDDDTVSGEYIFAIEKMYAEDMSMDEIMSTLGGDTATDEMVNATSEPYDDGEFVGTIVKFENEPLGSVDTEDGTLTRVGDTFVYEGAVPDPSSFEGMPDADKAVATMSITFPGAVTEHTGQLSGTTVTWNMMTITEAPHAVGGATGTGDDGGVPGGSSGSSGFPIWLIIVLGLVVVGGIIFFVVRHGKGKTVEAAEEG